MLNGPQGSGVEKAALYCDRTISPSRNIDLPTMGPSGSTRYLGVKFGAGRIGKVPAEQGKCDTTCLVESTLKPKQNIEFIQSFILPKWRHGLAFGRISIETYQKLDRHVRRVACKILHSPVNLSKEWIHLSKQMGGLGIPNVTEVTYLAKVRLMFDRLLMLVFGELRSLFSNENWRVPEASIPARGALLSINFGGRNGASPFKAAASKLSPVG